MIDLPGRYAFVDVETTGGNPGRHRVIEIAVVTLEDGAVVDEWSSLVHPQCSIPRTITGLTGIDDAIVADAPRFEQLRNELVERLDGRVFTAHNVRFDYGFVRNELARAGIDWRARQLCTVRLSRKLYPRHRGHGLDALIRRFGLSCDGRHRAMGDVRATIDFVRTAIDQHGPDAVAAAIDDQVRAPALPPHLPPETIEAIPDTPGVYLFHGDNDALLYIGKSTRLRTRVLSHFAGDHRSEKATRIAQTVRSVDWIDTAGELGALLLEARLVKERRPLHNRRLRKSGTITLLELDEDAEGYLRPRTIPAEIDEERPGAQRFGPYANAKTAKKRLQALADEHGLCPVRLGIETGRGPCFNHQLHRCRGACVGKEPAVQYNLRLLEALGPERVRPWPWNGPVVIHEENGVSGRSDLHVADRWCYLGTTRSLAELETLAENERVFDRDYYRLLRRWLERHPASARPLYLKDAGAQVPLF
ncbi:MAG: exonuclease domain-containing protein [Halofilum sp. (in: g-proteobacteria)]|nr:exonuclease domain-containing protein [Halofilum sp. (in: g-proteobacteria)]